MNRLQLKQQAKKEIRKNYLPWLLVALIPIALLFFQGNAQLNETEAYNFLSSNFQVQIQIRWLNILELLLMVPFARMAIHLSTGVYQNAKESLFDHERWLRDIGAMIVVGFYTLLWALLFIVPGIIKAYSYSMVPYILAEDDTLSISEAISYSQQMTDGYKFDLFVMDLSFILWDLAAALTFGLVGFYSIPYQKATWAQYYLKLAN